MLHSNNSPKTHPYFELKVPPPLCCAYSEIITDINVSSFSDDEVVRGEEKNDDNLETIKSKPQVQNNINLSPRGIGSKASFERPQTMVQQFQLPIVFLQEPMVECRKMDRYKRKLGMRHGYYNCSNKIWILWSNLVTVTIISDNIKIHTQNDPPFLFTVVYAKCTEALRMELWDDIRSLANNCLDPWGVIGDFNVIMGSEEKLGGRDQRFEESLEYLDCLNDCDLWSPRQAWRAKEKAIKLVRGDPAESYAKLPEACIRGWEYCRPIVVVDGAALRGSYGGTMLTANTMDPGGHILPLAYAIVDSENDASWTWFFEQFREAYGERENMCFMSDRNESIWKGTARVYPGLEHFACIWYLCCNVLKNFHRNIEDLKKLFFTMAKAYTIQQFEAIMQRIDQIDPRIRDYLYDIGYSKWSRAYSKCKRTWTMTSNIAESLNNVNMIARRLPVISLLEYMRVTVQKWIHKHNEEAAKTRSELTKKYDLMLQKSIALSSSMRVIPSTVDMHAVVDGPKRLKNFQDTYAIPVEPLPYESTRDIPSYVSESKLMLPGPKRTAGRPQLERWKGFADVKFK
ncbi:hypothetical protein MTR67_013117, partial [Solanum verrucosum]